MEYLLILLVFIAIFIEKYIVKICSSLSLKIFIQEMYPMKISEFTHCIDVNEEVTAFFHSINMQTIFAPTKLVRKIVGDKNLDTLFDPLVKPLIDRMLSMGLLVESEQDDVDLIEKHIKDLMSAPSVISVMYLLLTDACNMTCDYCFVKNQIPNKRNNLFMNLSITKKAVDFFAIAISRQPKCFNKRKSIIFYGGEPLLNKDVFMRTVEYITELKQKRILPDSLVLSLISNGLNFTPELADFVKNYKVGISISLDGKEDVTNFHRHDVFGKPVFDRVMKKIRMLQEKGIQVGVSCTINEKTLEHKNETIDFLVNTLSLKGVGFNIIRGEAVNLNPGYSKRASQFILDAYEIFRENGVFENRIMRKVKSFTKMLNLFYDCAAGGGNQIVIAPDGEVGICHGFIGSRKYFVGTVFDNDLIVENTETYKLWKKRSPLTIPKCRSCVALGTCGGGCPCEAELINGSLWDLDERFCDHSKMTINWLIKDLWVKYSV